MSENARALGRFCSDELSAVCAALTLPPTRTVNIMAKKFIPKPITSFDIFWREYPRKESKKKAAQKWRTLKLDARDLIKILTYLELAVQSDQWRDGGRFIPMASTFLNQERWLSEPPLISVPADGLALREADALTESELEAIRVAKTKEAEKTLTHWERRFADHVHGKTCQGGAVCAFIESKRPQLPIQ